MGRSTGKAAHAFEARVEVDGHGVVPNRPRLSAVVARWLLLLASSLSVTVGLPLRLGLLFVGAISCARAPETLWLPAEDAASVVLLLGGPDGSLVSDAFAYETTGGAIRLDVDASFDRDIYALRFDRSLPVLELESGQLELDVDGVPLMESERPPLVAKLRDGEAGGWSAVDALPDAFAAVRIAGKNPCVTFTIRSMFIPVSPIESTAIALSLDPSTLLMVTTGGSFFRITRDRATPLPEISSTTPHLAGERDPSSDEIWLGGRDGSVVHGTLEGGFVPAPSMTSRGYASARFSGGIGPNGFELFALTSSRTMERFDGDRWTLLYDGHDRAEERSRPRIAWVSPGSAIAIGSGNQLLLEWNGALKEVTLGLDFRLGEPDALFEVAGTTTLGGPIVGSRYGLVFVQKDGDWRRLPAPPTDGRVFVTAPIDRGLLFGGQNGVLTQYYDDTGYCEPLAAAQFAIAHLLPLDDGFALIEGNQENGDGIEVVILERL